METTLAVVDPSESLVKPTEFEDFVTRKNEEKEERDRTIGERNRQRRVLVLKVASVYNFFNTQAGLDIKKLELSDFEIGEREILRRAEMIKESQVTKESVEKPVDTRNFLARLLYPPPKINLEPKLSNKEIGYKEFAETGYFSFLGSSFGYKEFKHLFIDNDCRGSISKRMKGCTTCMGFFIDSFGGGFLGSSVREILISRELYNEIANEWE